MTTRTRYFVIASLLVLGVGLGTGLVAYYVGFPTSAFSSRGGPEELRYVPRDATVLAYANVQDVMSSDLRRRIKECFEKNNVQAAGPGRIFVVDQGTVKAS